MRVVIFSVLALFWVVAPVQAQSIMDNLPSAASDDYDGDAPTPPVKQAPPVVNPENYTVTDVTADVTADTSSHARDQALMQAERSAFGQLCGRLGIPDTVAAKLNDDAVAALVQSFEVQSERLSAVRYIGVFTIRFKPSAVQKKLGKSITAGATDMSGAPPLPTEDVKPVQNGPVSHMIVAVRTESLAAWSQIRRRLNAAPPVAQVQTIDLGRGMSHIDLSYGGTVSDLQQALTTQGLVLRQNAAGTWELYDGSMVTR